jgi:putative peptidoglycan lipid II flippase
VLWNLAQIGALMGFGRAHHDYDLAGWVAWGAVAGSALQLGVQLPTVRGLIGSFRLALDLANQHVRAVIRNFVPVVIGRGVVQISAYVDSILASFLPGGAVAALAYAQILYTLPVSLFGMAVSAAELPEMSSEVGSEAEIHAAIRRRIGSAVLRIAFFIVPSSVGFLALGDVVSAVLFQTGRFHHDDAVYVWTILAGATVGLLAATLGRLYASAFYALRDTRTPLRFALVRLVLTAGLGWFFALVLPSLLGFSLGWGAAGLTASAGVAGWVEFLLLRRSLHRRLGKVESHPLDMVRLWIVAGLGAAAAWGVKLSLGSVALHPILLGAVVLTPYGLVYLGGTWLLGVGPARDLASSAARRLGFGRG